MNQADRGPISHDTAAANALDAFRASGADHKNCAQAVLLYTLERFGAGPEEAEKARYFGGGVARLGLTCGALTGAALALAARDLEHPGEDTDESQGYQQLQDLISDFAEEFGDTACARLTGCDMSTREGYRRFRKEKINETHCEGYISWVCGRLESIL